MSTVDSTIEPKIDASTAPTQPDIQQIMSDDNMKAIMNNMLNTTLAERELQKLTSSSFGDEGTTIFNALKPSLHARISTSKDTTPEDIAANLVRDIYKNTAPQQKSQQDQLNNNKALDESSKDTVVDDTTKKESLYERRLKVAKDPNKDKDLSVFTEGIKFGEGLNITEPTREMQKYLHDMFLVLSQDPKGLEPVDEKQLPLLGDRANSVYTALKKQLHNIL